MDEFNVIGLMSGTSLDGVDICYATFQLDKNKKWNYIINNIETYPYSEELKKKLTEAKDYSGYKLTILNNDLGSYFGLIINYFIHKHKINEEEINFISSHGHTIFHQPEKKLTLQIGNGQHILWSTKLPVICDFRSIDVAYGGQGAPLVPIGDKLLFSEYDFCINLGGISNISYDDYNKMSDNFGNRVAFDMCPVNIVLNKLANEKGLEYDKNGELAKKGNKNEALLEKLSLLPYYQQNPPKSLGIEWIEKNIFPILNSFNISIEDKLRTFTIHIAQQIRTYLYDSNKKALFTGGGVHNSFLMENIRFGTPCEIIVPNKELIDFKEALIFGFLGVLRWRNEVNILSSVTGAAKNNIGGCIYNALPKS